MWKMSSEIASQKKELWHAEERTFNAFFWNKTTRDTNFSKSSEDNIITNPSYKNELVKKFWETESFKVSLKSGDTWQFHLGRIDELSPLHDIKLEKTIKGETKVIHWISFEEQKKILSSFEFWKKYLWKWDFLCYNDKEKKYIFFKMSDVIDFIITSTNWRILDTGRIKWNLPLNKKDRPIITFEYRSDKWQFVLWAHCWKSWLLLLEVLKENLKYHEVNFRSDIKEIHELNHITKSIYTKGRNWNIWDTFFDDEYLYICIQKKVWKRIKMENIPQ